MTRALSREESKLVTRHRLLEAAARILSEEGYGKLSAAAVARAAGIAQPTFYVHFSDKDDLVRTLAREKLEALRRPLKEARARVVGGHGIEALRDTFRLPLRALLDHPALFRLYVQEAHQPGSPFADEAKKLARELEDDLVEDLIAGGAPASTPAERDRLCMIAESMITLTETLGLGYLDGKYGDIERVVDVLTDFALGAIGALPRSAS